MDIGYIFCFCTMKVQGKYGQKVRTNRGSFVYPVWEQGVVETGLLKKK